MQLKECYIEKFGKLAEYKISFSSGTNCFVFENGYGKTTLTAFIRAMLYGMSDTKRGDLYENERKHYLPWSGGNAGGWLSFSVNGKEYRVERTFGTKPSQDSFALYELKTGKPCNDYTENLGKELFGIDKDGFERTVFLSERNISGATDNKTLSEKLGNLSGVDGDVGAMDDALELLDERRKFYQKKGGSGEIQEAELILRKLNAELEIIGESAKELEEHKARYAKLQQEILKINEAKSALGAIKEKEIKRTEKAMLKNYCEERQRELSSVKERMAVAEKFFAAGLPGYEELADKAHKLEKFRHGTAKAPELSPEHSALKEKIAEITPEKLEELNAALYEIGPGCRCKKFQCGIIASLLFTAIGALLSFFILPVGIFVTALGTVAIAFLAYTSGQKRKKAVIRVKKSAEAIGISHDADIAYEAARLRSDMMKLASLEEEYAAAVTAHQSEIDELVRIHSEVLSFISRYPVSSEDRALDEIRAMLTERELLISKATALESDIKKYSSAFTSDEDAENSEDAQALYELISSEGAVTAEFKITERKIRELSEKSESEDVVLMERDTMLEKIALYKANLATILKTADFLEKAKDNLTAKYLEKTKAAFFKYASLMGEDGDFSLDTSFKITKYEGGSSRDAEAFSLGKKNLYYFAVRLALVDSLYDSEAPFLVLDDPFASLDDAKMAAARVIISELAKTRQILYFTPSEARRV